MTIKYRASIEDKKGNFWFCVGYNRDWAPGEVWDHSKTNQCFTLSATLAARYKAYHEGCDYKVTLIETEE